MDKSTVYVENFPTHLTHSELARIFSRAGTILHVSMPKFKGNCLSKGFCFVEYSLPDSAEKAVQLFNNCVPEEFTNMACKNFI